MAAMRMTSNTDALILPVRNPTLTKGGTHYMSAGLSSSGAPIYITTSCKDPVLATKWLDYQYTLQGMYMNFYGVEGTSYTLDSQQIPQFTDVILQNPDYAPSDALAHYARGNGLGRYTDAGTYKMVAPGTVNYTKMSVDLWSDQKDILVSTSVTMNDAEAAEYNDLYTAIQTLTSEFTTNYILGTATQSWDEFQAQLKQYGIDRCTEIYQAAFDRFNAR
jgi:putative aldouronate transport system substrate-binding protein